MCGICGLIYINGHKTVEVNTLKILTQYLKCRGPENTGFFVDGNIGLGHTRLSIIDINKRANQPLTDQSGSVITYNGEIYNFPKLKKELEQVNSKFITSSDTEVIIKGYHQWGMSNFLDKCDGMFAFGLHDPKKNKLFLVRDRFGKKPLYYFQSEDELLFSSDIRSIWHLKKEKLSIDYKSLDYYLTELSTPQPRTIWKEIKQVKPGTYLEIDTTSGISKEVQYWRLPNEKITNISIEESLHIIEAKLVSSIKKRMLADVPVGFFLSGGIDSGLITALIANHSKEKIATYTVGLNNEEMNEIPEARIVAEKYETDHHEIILKPDVLKDFPEIIESFGEPFADSSILPSYYITKAISGKLKVAISGDGGDELFGGYPDYGLAFRTDQFDNLNQNRYFKHFDVFIDKIKSRFDGGRENKGAYIHYSRLKGHDRLFRMMGFNQDEKRKLINPDLFSSPNNFTNSYLQNIWDENKSNSLSETIMRSSLNTRLLNDYLVKVDRTSMMNSLEVRSPFLDHSLAEFAFSLPREYHFHNGHNKYLLKKIAAKYITNDTFDRPKRGFSIPLHSWMKNELNSFVRENLFDGPLNSEQWINMDYIETIYKDFMADKTNLSHKIWILVCLNIWLSKYAH